MSEWFRLCSQHLKDSLLMVHVVSSERYFRIQMEVIVCDFNELKDAFFLVWFSLKYMYEVEFPQSFSDLVANLAFNCLYKSLNASKHFVLTRKDRSYIKR